ncbi:MAG: DUF4249 domain-containing protein [Bacteroidales bacterium]
MRMTKNMGLIACCLILLFYGCVDPFEPVLDESDAQDLLVVEGLITNETGAFGIRLTSSAPVYNTDPNIVNEFRPVSGAVVQITDDRENQYLLFENEAGWYETEEKDLNGTPGYSYTLSVTTPDGIQYESSPVLMQEGVEVEQVYFEEFGKTYFDQDAPYTEHWINIMLDARAPGEEVTYFKWEFEETWEFEMPGYIRVDHGTDAFSPPPTIETVEIEAVKKHCWVSGSSQSILVKSTIDSPSNEIRNFVIQSIGPPDDRLNIKYSILLKQYVIARDLYDFFRMVRESNEETGGIYEKTPARIPGNIKCCDGSRQALGYFMASAVHTKRIFIEAAQHSVSKGTAFAGCGWTTDIPRYLPVFLYGTYNRGETDVWSTNNYCTDCRIRGTSEQPDFWE